MASPVTFTVEKDNVGYLIGSSGITIKAMRRAFRNVEFAVDDTKAQASVSVKEGASASKADLEQAASQWKAFLPTLPTARERSQHDRTLRRELGGGRQENAGKSTVKAKDPELEKRKQHVPKHMKVDHRKGQADKAVGAR